MVYLTRQQSFRNHSNIKKKKINNEIDVLKGAYCNNKKEEYYYPRTWQPPFSTVWEIKPISPKLPPP